MQRRQFLQTLGGASALAASGRGATRPPNFVFILFDDMGWADVGYQGSDFYETPNIDRLASQGMRFSNAYAACPVCSPTRASIMTGKYPARLHLTNFIPGRQTRPYARVLAPEFRQELPLEETTVAETLKSGGVRDGPRGQVAPRRRAVFARTSRASTTSMRPAAGISTPKWTVQPKRPIPEGQDRADGQTAEAERFLEQNRCASLLPLSLLPAAAHSARGAGEPDREVPREARKAGVRGAAEGAGAGAERPGVRRHDGERGYGRGTRDEEARRTRARRSHGRLLQFG